MFADVIAVTGCATDGVLGAVIVRYGPSGRPRQMSPPSAELSPACREAAFALGATALDSDDRLPPAGPVLLMLPFQSAFAQCMSDEDRAGSDVVPVRPGAAGGDRIQEPKKLKQVNPIYPVSARQERVQGVVILEATIARAGCVRALQILRGVDPRLDAAAVAAVAGWSYTPTVFEGRPVPVLMTITVNFRLN
jgi:TonB family protein